MRFTLKFIHIVADNEGFKSYCDSASCHHHVNVLSTCVDASPLGEVTLSFFVVATVQFHSETRRNLCKFRHIRDNQSLFIKNE